MPPPKTMTTPASNARTCNTQGCTARKARSKEHCWNHVREQEHTLRMSGDMQKSIRSVCCNAKCTKGDEHESGNQYCKDCSKACFWKIVYA